MMKLFRWRVIIVCVAWLLSLFGCGKGQLVDGPGMERDVWSEFTLSRCSAVYETIYSYTVKYDDASREAWLYVKVHEGQTVEKNIRLESEAVSALFNLDMMTFPDAQALCGTVLGLSVTDLNARVCSKQISGAMEKEILTILTPYVNTLNTDSDDEEPFMLDGPDMEYVPPWTEFTLSRSDSSTLYTFWFTVKDTALVTGMCQDKAGKVYETETGIPIDEEALWALRDKALEQLPDANDNQQWPEGLELPLDGSSIALSVTLSDGTVLKKKASGELSMEIYQLLLPYFINNQ